MLPSEPQPEVQGDVSGSLLYMYILNEHCVHWLVSEYLILLHISRRKIAGVSA